MVRHFISHSTATALFLSFLVPTALACTTVLVGKKASEDGSTMIARNEDMRTAWAKHFVVRPAGENKAADIFVSKGNGFNYPLPKERYKYTATPEWTTQDGLYEEAGINQFGVAMSATESGSANDDVLREDPLVENGIAEDAMLTIVLPYIKTAREGVERLGKIVQERGAAEVNGVIFSDEEEIWYMEIGSGHHWVAVRVPDDKYAVIGNKLSIENIDFNDKDHFLTSENLLNFVQRNALYNPKTDGDFNFKKIFGLAEDDAHDKQYNYPRMWEGQRILTPSLKQDIHATNIPLFQTPDEKISVSDVAKVLSAHYNGTDYDPYGKYEGKLRPINVPQTMESHILQCRPKMPSAVGCVHWLSLGVPESSVFVPFYSGINNTPAAYQKGTNMPDADSAYWIFRTTGALTMPYYHEFMPKLTQPQLEAIRQQVMMNFKREDRQILKTYNNDPKKAEQLMTEITEEWANDVLEEVKKLNATLLKEMTGKTAIEHNEAL